MTALIRLFWQICLLQRTPQDLPYSPPLLALTLLGQFLILLSLELLSLDLGQALAMAALSMMIMVASCYLLLYLRSHPERLLQTLTALAASDIIIGGLALLLTSFFVFILDDVMMAGMLQLFLMLWSLLVLAHILRHALSIQMISALFIALAYMSLSYMVAVSILMQGQVN